MPHTIHLVSRYISNSWRRRENEADSSEAETNLKVVPMNSVQKITKMKKREESEERDRSGRTAGT